MSRNLTTETLQRLPQKALDVLYDRLLVQAMPDGAYEGRAWIPGHPILGWLACLVWRGKVFTVRQGKMFTGPLAGRRVKNLIVGLSMLEGHVWLSIYDGRADEIVIDYQRLGIHYRLRQVAPVLYLGRLKIWGVVVNFTLSQEVGK